MAPRGAPVVTTNWSKKIVLARWIVGNPFRAREEALVCSPRMIRFTVRIDVQDYPYDFPPVRPLAFCLQKARVRHDMLLVIGGEHRFGWRGIRDVRIKRWF